MTPNKLFSRPTEINPEICQNCHCAFLYSFSSTILLTQLKVLEIISRYCAILSAIGCTEYYYRIFFSGGTFFLAGFFFSCDREWTQRTRAHGTNSLRTKERESEWVKPRERERKTFFLGVKRSQLSPNTCKLLFMFLHVILYCPSPYCIPHTIIKCRMTILISYFPWFSPREDCSIRPLAPLFAYLRIWDSLIRKNVGTLLRWFSSMRFHFDQEGCCPCCNSLS